MRTPKIHHFQHKNKQQNNMMMTFTLVRRTALVATRTRVPACTILKCWASSSSKLPPEEYYQGHLMADHLEYLDDMIDKTIKMEESMEGLKDTYQKKKNHYNNIGFTTSSDLDALFDAAAMQKEELSEQISQLKATLEKAKSFAVDAPDGTSDAMRAENKKKVDDIIDYAAKHEDKEKIKYEHKMEDAVRKERARDPEHDW